MELKIRDVATFLGETEESVLRWARRGEIPAHRVQDQYLFNRVELQEWAVAHNHKVSPDLFIAEGEDAELPSLSEAVARGGIHYGVRGDRREQTLKEITLLPEIPEGVDRALLLELLLGREMTTSTAIGGGIAIPHPRHPLVVEVKHPSVLLCFLETPVDFNALDGKPVRVLFAVLSPSIRMHLKMLGKLSFALRDPDFRNLLDAPAKREEILSRLRELDEASDAEFSKK
jgi:nitrogen PTS system EIIA component